MWCCQCALGTLHNPLEQGIKTCLDFMGDMKSQFLEMIKALADDAKKRRKNMMTAGMEVGAKVSGRVITLYPKNSGVKIGLMGSSVDSSIKPTRLCSTNHITLILKDSEEGIVALEVDCRNNYHFFIEVSCINGIAKIDLDKNWLPSEDIIASFYHDDIVVSIGDDRYTTREEPENGEIYVAEGRTLFCKYIAKIVSSQAILDAVSDEKKVSVEDLIAENAELGKRVKWLERDAETKLETIQNREYKIVELMHKLDDGNHKINKLEEKINKLKKFLETMSIFTKGLELNYNNSFGNREKSMTAMKSYIDAIASERVAVGTLGLIP